MVRWNGWNGWNGIRLWEEHRPAQLTNEEGLELHAEISGSSFYIGPIKPQPIDLQVKAGDCLNIYKISGKLGHKATEDSPATISCTLPQVIQQVRSGDRIFIDDGKIGAIVLSTSSEDHIELEITSPIHGTSKIRPEKGLNFPDSALAKRSLLAHAIYRTG